MKIKAFVYRTYVLAIIIFFISLIPRVILLDKIPLGLPNDNIIFALNAKAIFLTGRDVTGTWHPLSFSTLPDEPAQSEIIYTFLAPTVGAIESPLFAAHIFNALIGSILPVVVFLIVLRLLGKPQAILAGLVMSLNPWGIFFGRSLFEAGLALFFYMLAFLILIYLKSRNKLLALIPLGIGFYTYMAYKVTLIPYIALISLYAWHQLDKKKYTKVYITIVFVCIALFLLFMVNLKSQNTSQRLGEASFVSTAKIEQMVNSERQESIENHFSGILSNKATLAAKEITAKYINAFSPQFLFVSTEQTQRFNIYNHGYFYYLDVIFFLIGFCFLFIEKRNLWYLFTALILIAPLPSVLSSIENSYAMRSSLYVPIFCIFIGIGIHYFLTLFKKRNHRIIALVVVAVVYFLLMANFFYTYFLIQPIKNSEGQAFSSRILSSYLERANKQNTQVIVLSQSPKDLFKNYLYFSKDLNKSTVVGLRTNFLNKDYSSKNLQFINCNELDKLEDDKIYIYPPGYCPQLKNTKPTLSIAQPADSGTVFNIYQDEICKNFNLEPYIGKIELSDLEVEKLSDKNFCKTYIVDFNTSN